MLCYLLISNSETRKISSKGQSRLIAYFTKKRVNEFGKRQDLHPLDINYWPVPIMYGAFYILSLT